MPILQLANELLLDIFHSVPPSDTLRNVQSVCRRWRQLCADQGLWRHHCLTTFKYWGKQHDLPGPAEPLSKGDWKGLFVERVARQHVSARLFEELITSESGRLPRMRDILATGLDAKDFLLKQYYPDPSCQDDLARSYWARSLLRCLHRHTALRIWQQAWDRRLDDGPSPPRELETVLGAFEMFFLDDDRPYEAVTISLLLDSMADQFRTTQTDWIRKSTRQRALAINHWLRTHNYTGMADPENNYRNLSNCFIGEALRSKTHDSLPLVSAAIFCCLAERMGLKAGCCLMPAHVHVILRADDGLTLDGDTAKPNESKNSTMYLDPFKRDSEVPVQDLLAWLRAVGVGTDPAQILTYAPNVAVAVRLAHNIDAAAGPPLNRDREASLAGYASVWAKVMLTTPGTIPWARRVAALGSYEKVYVEDEWLLKDVLEPVLQEHVLPPDLTPEVLHLWESQQEADSEGPYPRLAAELGFTDPVPYSPGQVFRHTTGRWVGVIHAWEGRANDGGGGMGQILYYCLRQHQELTYVIRAENVQILTKPPEGFELDHFPDAGKYFKKFDPERCAFVSNVTQSFPEV